MMPWKTLMSPYADDALEDPLGLRSNPLKEGDNDA